VTGGPFPPRGDPDDGDGRERHGDDRGAHGRGATGPARPPPVSRRRPLADGLARPGDGGGPGGPGSWRPAGGGAPDPRAFAEALERATPRPRATPVIVAANVGVWLLMVGLFGISPMAPDPVEMIRWGAGYAPKTLHGEPWRLVTSTFLHYGLLHVGSNMYVLWSGGRLVEKLLGTSGFVAAYAVAGLAGGVASLLFERGIVAGASGAVFGVFGALGGYLIAGRRWVPRAYVVSLRRAVIEFVMLNTVIALMIPAISFWAHTGGLVGGFVVGLLVARPPTPEARRGAVVRASAVTLALGGALLASLPLLPAPPRDPRDYGSPFERRARPEDPRDALRSIVGDE
jgi:membrane associated rhomboid family serine protease